MIVQILDAQSDGLARPRASDRQNVAEQAELVIVGIGGTDEVPHLVVWDDHVAHVLRIRQACKPDFLRLPILNPLVVLPRQLQGGEQASADAIDRGGCDLAEQAVAPLLQLGNGERCTGLASNTGARCTRGDSAL
jgi:hypothetical protein